MGVGEFLSSKATNEWILSERRREEWEMENYPEGEIKEMIDIFHEKGLSEADAKLVIETMAKYKDFFVDMMMQQELELQVGKMSYISSYELKTKRCCFKADIYFSPNFIPRFQMRITSRRVCEKVNWFGLSLHCFTLPPCVVMCIKEGNE